MKRFGDSLHMVENEILIYQNEDGQTKIDVKFQDETVWLTQAQLCELYQTSKSNISEHIKHIFEEGELEEAAVVRKFRTTAADGKNYNTKMMFFYLHVVSSFYFKKCFLRYISNTNNFLQTPEKLLCLLSRQTRLIKTV